MTRSLEIEINLPAAQRPIIFIMGSSRSGTTMLGRILNANDAVHTLQEVHFFEQLWDPINGPDRLNDREATLLVSRMISIFRNGYYSNHPDQLYKDEAEQLLANSGHPRHPELIYSSAVHYEVSRSGKTIPCDKTPRNIYYLDSLLTLYPNAHMLMMIRDPRDVLLSQKYKWRRRKLGATKIPRRQLIRFWSNYHPITMSILWNSAVNAYLEFQNHPRVKLICFEDLLNKPDEIVQEICEFNSIEFQEEMLQIHQIGSSHSVDSNRLGINPDVSGHWLESVKAEDADLYICQKMTETIANNFGYQSVEIHPNWIAVIFLYITWPLKSLFALLLNVERVKNIKSSAQQRIHR